MTRKQYNNTRSNAVYTCEQPFHPHFVSFSGSTCLLTLQEFSRSLYPYCLLYTAVLGKLSFTNSCNFDEVYVNVFLTVRDNSGVIKGDATQMFDYDRRDRSTKTVIDPRIKLFLTALT